ncbi:MAG TPA: hypothetical protein VKH35_02980 [Thermoanaerobaculia bacterium]|nr:hypothetical protein [Thermoanaerobaculia bacterium]
MQETDSVIVYATESGDVVLEQRGEDGHRDSIRIPHDKIHPVTVWMRRIAAEFDGLQIPPAGAEGLTPDRHKVI